MKRPLSTVGAGLLLLGAAAGCGARTPLEAGAPAQGGAGGGTSSTTSSFSTTSTSSFSTTSTSSSTGGAPPCLTNADCDDGIDCTVDTCTPAGCVHTLNDAACNDGIACTTDTCTLEGCLFTPDNAYCNDGKLCTIDTCDPGNGPTDGGCTHTFSNAPCDDGIACTTDTCDPTTETCSHVPCDSLCDDGIFCDGVERCDATVGCVHGPPSCQLGLPCSADSCTEATSTCTHTQSGGCAPSLRLLVCDDAGNLLSISPYGEPNIMLAASNGTVWFDVAILDGRWFAIDGVGGLDELVPGTNQVKTVLPAPAANSLGAGPDGYLYAASDQVYRIDPDTGASNVLGPLPPGYTSSGDAVFFGAQLFVSTNGPCGGALVQFDPTSGTSTVIGGDGLGCVYGLAASAGTMFLVNCDGTVGTFDPQTGVVVLLSTTGVQVYGADVLP